MTALADSKHCAFAVGQRARDAKRERRNRGACLLQEELVLGLEPAPERLLEAKRVHHESRVASKAAQTGKTHACDQHEHNTREHAATGGTYKGRSSARNLSAGSGTFVSGTHRTPAINHRTCHVRVPAEAVHPLVKVLRQLPVVVQDDRTEVEVLRERSLSARERGRDRCTDARDMPGSAPWATPGRSRRPRGTGTRHGASARTPTSRC